MMFKCSNCQRDWCSYAGTRGDAVFSCLMYQPPQETVATNGTSNGAVENHNIHCDSKTATYTTIPFVQTISDCELLKEFKRRFNGSVLYESVGVDGLLKTIGEKRINKFLKEMREYRKKE